MITITIINHHYQLFGTLFSGPPNLVELRSSGGAGEYCGATMGLYQLLSDEKGDGQSPVYRQQHEGDNEHYYLYRWDIRCKLQT